MTVQKVVGKILYIKRKLFENTDVVKNSVHQLAMQGTEGVAAKTNEKISSPINLF